jgi:hypothetical protein
VFGGFVRETDTRDVPDTSQGCAGKESTTVVAHDTL